jgi:hypothetical protein
MALKAKANSSRSMGGFKNAVPVAAGARSRVKIPDTWPVCARLAFVAAL